MSTSELVGMLLCTQTVDAGEGPCKRQKPIDGEVLSSFFNDIDDISRTRLKEWFPVLARSHETNDWSLQLKCFDPNVYGSNRDMEGAFSSSEFVGLCVWLLFTEHSEINKNDVLEALQFVKSSFSKDPFMSNDVQPDEVIEEDNHIVADLLCLDSREVKKQVCCALALPVSCDRDRKIAFCDGIQYKLIQLVDMGLETATWLLFWSKLTCPGMFSLIVLLYIDLFCSPIYMFSFSVRSEDSNIICPLRTIAYIALYDTGMHKKIIETVINNNWLARIMMRTECVSIMVEAGRILHLVAYEKHNRKFWWLTVKAFIPGLIRWSRTRHLVLKRVALDAIKSITSGASLVWMEEMVDADCIEALFEFAFGLVDSPDFEIFLDVIWNIFNPDKDDDMDDDCHHSDVGELRNEYAEIIDGIEVGWVLFSKKKEFFNDHIAGKAKRLLSDYAPQYLEKYC